MSLNKSSALPIQAHMTNCQVAIALQEDFTLTYGSSIGLQKDYNVRQLMFNTGGTSGGGHFITASVEHQLAHIVVLLEPNTAAIGESEVFLKSNGHLAVGHVRRLQHTAMCQRRATQQSICN